MSSVLQPLLGIPVLIGIAYVFSTDRRSIHWRQIGIGLLLQVLLAVLLLRTPGVSDAMQALAGVFVRFLGFSLQGAEFVFGRLTDRHSFGVIFAFQVLPSIIFFGAFTALLFYFGILQFIIRWMALVMKRFMQLSGAESLSAAANVFLGQTEAPLLVKPYIRHMTRSELLCLMTVGMSTVAGGVMGAYVTFLGNGDPELERQFATHLLTASLMNAPAGILMAKIMVPETETFDNKLEVSRERLGTNVIDALTLGVTDAVKLAVNVGAILLAFMALMLLFNFMLEEYVGSWTGLNSWVAAFTDGRYRAFNFSFIAGLVCSPLAWLMGVPVADMLQVGQLLGTKVVLNEFFSYQQLGEMRVAGQIGGHSIVVATYALCGFANFASIGIQVGGLSALAPERRAHLASLGTRAVLGGTLACLLTGAIAGIVLSF